MPLTPRLKLSIGVALGAGLAALAVLWLGAINGLVPRGSAARLDNLGPAPAFRLIDQSGQPFGSDELGGRVVLVDFIYTSCTDICPLLSAQMQTIQGRLQPEGLLEGRVQLVSLTVDPARDTPDVLKAYAERYRADPGGWRFLTGEEPEVRAVVVEGFRVGVERLAPDPLAAPAASGYEVVHSGRLILIDRAGRIRAYYNTSDLDVDQVLRDIRSLV